MIPNNKNYIFLFFIFFLLFSALNAQTQTPTVSADAEVFYHKALNFYLDGNYDQAILFAAESLEKDPGYEKSKNLLSVLTSEKEQEGKTVIWLAGKPVLVTPTPMPIINTPVENNSGVGKNVEKLQTQLNNFYHSQTTKNEQVNGQLQVIQELVKDNSSGQYQELKKAQTDIYQELEKINKDNHNFWLLYCLCTVSVIFSIAAILKKPKR
jgi:hypothetical protein